MARSEQRILGFTIAILILALAVGLLGWADRDSDVARRRMQRKVDAATGRVGVLEGQLREHGIEPAPDTTTTTTALRRSSARTTTTTRRIPVTTPPASTTTTATTARPSPASTTTTTSPPPPPPPTTTSTTQCIVRLSGQCTL